MSTSLVIFGCFEEANGFTIEGDFIFSRVINVIGIEADVDIFRGIREVKGKGSFAISI